MHTESLKYEAVLHPASVRELLAPAIMCWSYKASSSGALNPQAYSLGLMLSDYEGQPVIHHSGGTWGFVSDIIWLPRLEVGAVLFYNTEAKGLVDIEKIVLSLLVPALRTKLVKGKPKVPSKQDCKGRLKVYKHKMGDRLRVSIPKEDEHVVRVDFLKRDGEKTKGIAVIEKSKTEEKKQLKLCEREFYIDRQSGDLPGEQFKFSAKTNEEGTSVWVKRGHSYFQLAQ